MIGWRHKNFREMLDNMANGLYFVDSEGIIQYWNTTSEALTGYTVQEITGTHFEKTPLRYEDKRGNALLLYEHPITLCFQKRQPVSKNLFVRTKDNRTIHIEENATPLFKKSKMIGVVSIFRDVSRCIQIAETELKAEKKERLIPICGWCKKIKNDENYWEQLEVYLTNEGFGVFTHGMCPVCAEKIFDKRIYMESYQNISKAISSSIALNEVLQLIVTNVVKVMNVKASSLRLLNKDSQQLELVAYHGLSEKYAHKGPVNYDASIDDALAGKSVSVYDIAEHKGSKYYKEALEEGIRSILSIPMRFQKEVIGILRMYTIEPIKYTEEDLRFITTIAEQGAIAIINAKRFERAVSKEKEYLRVFEEITKAVSSTLHVNEVLNMIVKKIPEVMGLKAATIRLLDHTGKKLKLAAAYGLSKKYLNRGPVDTEENIREALNEKPVAIYDVTTDSRVIYQKEAAEEGIKSMLTLPVIARGKILGILRLLTDKPKYFSQQEIDFAASLAEQCGTAIENATMYGKIKNEYENIMRYFDGVIVEKE
ncbi:MAG: GAF domain-containing protein [Thermodesulfovibrionia bacterium]|nr:GAF domain-containing protein [Thermodesulfovibrionia bacterium]